MNLQWVDCGDGRHVLRDVDAYQAPSEVDAPRMNTLATHRGRRTSGVEYGLPMKGTAAALANPAPSYNKAGFACFSNDKQRREYAARSGGKWGWNE